MTIAMYPDRLTPEFVQSISFPPARLGRRGVDEAHVRVFCEWVESELALLLSEKTSLEEEVTGLRQRLRDDDAVAGCQDGHVKALYILARAQQTADKYVANAQEYSREIAEDARRRRDEILYEAELRASALHVGLLAAPTPDGPAPGGAAEPESLSPSHDLAAELVHLRTFSNVCRTRLRAYLESLARSIDEWEQAEGSAETAPSSRLSRAAR